MRARREQQHNSNKKKNETLIHFLFCSSSAAARFVNYDTNTHNKFHIISKAINEKFTFFSAVGFVLCEWHRRLVGQESYGTFNKRCHVKISSIGQFFRIKLWSHTYALTVSSHFARFGSLFYCFFLDLNDRIDNVSMSIIHHFFFSTQWSIN